MPKVDTQTKEELEKIEQESVGQKPPSTAVFLFDQRYLRGYH